MTIAAGVISEQTQFYKSTQPFRLESGESLAHLQIAYRSWGTLNEAGDNAVLICHALTGSADADDWWPELIGDGAALDPANDFIVCSNVIGSCYGSTGPFATSDDGSTRLGLQFPMVTVRDMVRAQRELLDFLGVKRLSMVVGPSLGGMQTLEWATTFPDFVGGIVPIGVSARHSAWCIGIGEAQRAAISTDGNWRDGAYDDSAKPKSGLAAARMMAMVTYRSWHNFEARFRREADQRTDFSASSYLNYQGKKLVERFDAASYFRLTQAMDSHDVGREREGTVNALNAIRCPALVVSVSSDILYPPVEQEFLAEHIPAAKLAYLNSDHGHDGILIDLAPLSDLIRQFRQQSG
ncbi:MAG: homoserine O-acetyltransferase [Woeseiaceae bacterium]